MEEIGDALVEGSSKYVKQWLRDLPVDLGSESLPPHIVFTHRQADHDSRKRSSCKRDSPQQDGLGQQRHRSRSPKNDAHRKHESSRPAKRHQHSNHDRYWDLDGSCRKRSNRQHALHGGDRNAPPAPASGGPEEPAIEVQHLVKSGDIAQTADEKYAKKPRRKTRVDKYEYKEHLETKVKTIPLRPDHSSKTVRRKRNGEKLSESFKAPNVDTDRLTLRPSNSIGIFSRARSSARNAIQGLPDLSFTEMTFLKKPKEIDNARYQQLPKTRTKRDKGSGADISDYFSRPLDARESDRLIPGYSSSRQHGQTSPDTSAKQKPLRVVSENDFGARSKPQCLRKHEDKALSRSGFGSYVTWSTSSSGHHRTRKVDINEKGRFYVRGTHRRSTEEYTKHALFEDLADKHIKGSTTLATPKLYDLEDLKYLADVADNKHSQNGISVLTDHNNNNIPAHESCNFTHLSVPSSNWGHLLSQPTPQKHKRPPPLNTIYVGEGGTGDSAHHHALDERCQQSLTIHDAEVATTPLLDTTQCWQLQPRLIPRTMPLVGRRPNQVTENYHDVEIEVPDRIQTTGTLDDIQRDDLENPDFDAAEAYHIVGPDAERLPSTRQLLCDMARSSIDVPMYNDDLVCRDEDGLDNFDMGLLQADVARDPQNGQILVAAVDEFSSRPHGAQTEMSGRWSWNSGNGNKEDMIHYFEQSRAGAQNHWQKKYDTFDEPFQGYSRPHTLY